MPRRRLTLLQAVSLNMGMMVGIGPFITIPVFLRTLGGPQAMIGWILGALVAIADGLVWSELAAAFPGSGGTFHFYDIVYGRRWFGRLIKFLFVWQFLFSAPLELASGAIGLSDYAGFLFAWLKAPAATLQWGDWAWTLTWGRVLAVAAMLSVVAGAYRRVEVAGRVMTVLWLGMLATVGVVILSGLTQFDPAKAFDFPPNPWRGGGSNLAFGLGAALAIAMYDLLGYYQVCYLGDEVENPSRTFPRAIMLSVVAVSSIYLLMNTSIIGVLPWRKAMESEHVASDFMRERFGGNAARLMTVMIIWTAAASIFAGILSYSRVPYAASKSGHFFSWFATLHPRGDFPHRSLVVVGAVSAVACLFDLGIVIDALLTSRILIQFVGQIATVVYIRNRPELNERLSFRMWLYPLPAIVALVGLLYVFCTTKPGPLQYGLLSLVLGILAFGVWDRAGRAK
jgi:amino acid transporter